MDTEAGEADRGARGARGEAKATRLAAEAVSGSRPGALGLSLCLSVECSPPKRSVGQSSPGGRRSPQIQSLSLEMVSAACSTHAGFLEDSWRGEILPHFLYLGDRVTASDPDRLRSLGITCAHPFAHPSAAEAHLHDVRPVHLHDVPRAPLSKPRPRTNLSSGSARPCHAAGACRTAHSCNTAGPSRTARSCRDARSRQKNRSFPPSLLPTHAPIHRHIINATEDISNFFSGSSSLHYHRCPIKDRSDAAPDMEALFPECVRFLDS